MTEQEVINSLKAGGRKRENALTYVFRHRSVRASVGKVLRPYSKKLSTSFPSTKHSPGGKRIPFIDFFLTEAIIKLIKHIDRNSFRGESFPQLVKFISSECKFRCLDWLKANNNLKEDYREDPALLNKRTQTSTEQQFIYEEKHKILRAVLAKLGKNCQKLLLMCYGEYSHKEIKEELGFSSTDVVKSKKWRCMKKLEAFLRAHPDMAKLLGGRKVPEK